MRHTALPTRVPLLSRGFILFWLFLLHEPRASPAPCVLDLPMVISAQVQEPASRGEGRRGETRGDEGRRGEGRARREKVGRGEGGVEEWREGKGWREGRRRKMRGRGGGQEERRRRGAAWPGSSPSSRPSSALRRARKTVLSLGVPGGFQGAVSGPCAPSGSTSSAEGFPSSSVGSQPPQTSGIMGRRMRTQHSEYRVSRGWRVAPGPTLLPRSASPHPGHSRQEASSGATPAPHGHS